MSKVPPPIYRETIGAKLRRLAIEGTNNNFNNLAPLSADTPWTALEASIKQGSVRYNAGIKYVALGSGTCGDAAPTLNYTKTHYDKGTQASGVLWDIAGFGTTISDDALKPTVTVTNTAPTDLTQHYTALNAAFTLNGCYTTFNVTTNSGTVNEVMHYNLNRFTDSTATIARGCNFIEFMTDSPKFAIPMISGGSFVNVIIDGRKYSTEGIYPNAASPTFIVVDFGVYRKNRNIQIYYTNKSNGTWGGIWTLPKSKCWSSLSQGLRFCLMTDSLDEGSIYGPFMSTNSVGQILSRRLGIKDFWRYSTGGTGYINNKSGTKYTFYQRADQIVTLNPDIVFVLGSVNDTSYNQTTLKTEMKATWAKIIAGSNLKVLIIGGLLPVNLSDSNLTPTENTLITAIAEFKTESGFNRIYFVPIATDANTWLDANNIQQYISTLDSDIHPADCGTYYYGNRLADSIINNIWPAIL
jgi:hypothetical protein